MPKDTKPGPKDDATGQGDPKQGEIDGKRQKLPAGESAHRAAHDAPRRKFNPATDLRQKGSRGAKPSQKSKGR